VTASVRCLDSPRRVARDCTRSASRLALQRRVAYRTYAENDLGCPLSRLGGMHSRSAAFPWRLQDLFHPCCPGRRHSGGVASLRSVCEPIACTDARLSQASSFPCPPTVTCDTPRYIEGHWCYATWYEAAIAREHSWDITTTCRPSLPRAKPTAQGWAHVLRICSMPPGI
jgi:hypothetical protein